tara:strand:- start:2388 stop:3407 length:1020 start_codon:yes stop_codon:yes gene_type:complete
MRKAKLSSLLKLVFSIGLGVYLTWFFFENMSEKDINVFKSAVLNSNLWYIGFSLVLALLSYFSRAYRWGLTLHPLGHKSSFWNQYHSLMIGYLVNMTIPRAGEFSRAIMLKRSDNIPVAASFGTIVMERLVDMLILLTITLCTVFSNREQASAIVSSLKIAFLGKEETQTSSNPSSFILFGGLLILILVVWVVLRKRLRLKVVSFISSLKAGVLSIFKVKRSGAYLFHTALIWGSYLIMFALPFWALQETANLPISGLFLAFIFGAIGISFTNGGMGAYPLLIGITTAYYLKEMGVDDALAIGNAVGMVIWATQTLFLILLGLISLVLMPRKYKSNEKD